MNLPAAFLQRMRSELGKQFPDFLHSYELPVRRGIRVNTLKITREAFEKISPFPLRPVPWEENGFYVGEEKTGAFPFHFAGLYYSQEPSAMCAVPMLNVTEGERVLDLCAAPGGKTTQIAQAMRGKGILVANEYVFARARILVQNVERLGIENCIVTSCDPARLAEQFEGWFDKILVDAPCSGEGMFKREENAVPEWSEENVARCALRQREILRSAAKMLRPGGRLVYSTCTFSREEDEGQIEGFLQDHPDFSLADRKTIYPHLAEGEGHFAAALIRAGNASARQGRLLQIPPSAETARIFGTFCKEFFAQPRDMRICALPFGEGEGERLFALPEGTPREIVKCAPLRAGVFLGWRTGKIFKPAHALAMSLKREEARRFVSLSEAESKKYLRGEVTESGLEDGWCVVGVGDYPLGMGKIVSGRVKNHLPAALRMSSRD